MDNNYFHYLDSVLKEQKSMVDLLMRWSNQNSFSENIPGLSRMLSILKDDFSVLNGKTEIIPLGKSSSPAALKVVKHKKAAIQILFAGHMDTVFPPGSPFQKAYQKEELLYGPGVADMKGGLLIMLKALEILEKSPWAGKIGWEILITPDEETGSQQSFHLYQNAAKNHLAGFIFEPSFPDGALVSSRKGSANIEVVVKGRPAHVGRDFFSGRNALVALSRFILNASELTDHAKGITVNIGQIEAGEAFNIVPSHAFAKVNIRTKTLEDELSTQECLKLLAEEANAQEGICLTLKTIVTRPPKTLDEQTKELFGLFQECGKELGEDLTWRETGGVCDGNILAAAGLPTVDTLGPIGGGLHTPQEYLEISSLIKRSRLTALLLLKLASGKIKLPNR